MNMTYQGPSKGKKKSDESEVKPLQELVSRLAEKARPAPFGAKEAITLQMTKAEAENLWLLISNCVSVINKMHPMRRMLVKKVIGRLSVELDDKVMVFDED